MDKPFSIPKTSGHFIGTIVLLYILNHCNLFQSSFSFLEEANPYSCSSVLDFSWGFEEVRIDRKFKKNTENLKKKKENFRTFT